jgi:single-stranded-DNA-specific exonuclease
MSQKWIYKPAPDEEIVDSISSSIGFGTLESKILVHKCKVRNLNSFKLE